jgi:hypothetical protein
VNGQRPAPELDPCQPGNAIIDLADQGGGDSLERIRSLDAQADDALVQEVQVLLPQKLGESSLRLLYPGAIGVQCPELLTRPRHFGVDAFTRIRPSRMSASSWPTWPPMVSPIVGGSIAWSRGVNVIAARNAATATTSRIETVGMPSSSG